jgi:excisionase family DNA binding protein
MSLNGRPAPRSEWVGIHEAAALVGVSPATLRRWSDAGDIDAFTTPGGHRRFSRSAIAGLLATERVDAPTGEQFERVRLRLDRVLRDRSRRLAAESPWAAAFDDDDRADIALQGRRIVDGLVAAVDERSAAAVARSPATDHAAVVCGELAARRGVGLGALIAAGLRLDGIAVHEIATAARRLDLDGPTTARWLDLAACTLDRLLSEAMRGHALVHAVPKPHERTSGFHGSSTDGPPDHHPERRRDAGR